MPEAPDLDEMLRRLSLPRVRETWKEWVEKAAREEMSPTDLLRNLFTDELCARQENRLRRLMREANFPFHGTLEQFDYRLRPELRRQVFQTYLEDSFVKEGRALDLIGAPGLGKTHLSVAIGIRVVQRYCRVRFVTVQDLMNRVLMAEGPRERERVLRPYQRCELLILDEFGYLTPDPETGPVLYELVAARYEKRATIITSNKSLSEWGRVLHDTALASALVDRLMHHGDVYYLKGESYRLRGKKPAGAVPSERTEEPSLASGGPS